MALSDVLTKLKNQRTAIVTAINGKGGTLSADATLADCATAIGNISGGSGGLAFYKCAELVAGVAGAVQGATLSFHGVCQMDGMTPETADLSFTMEDATKTGWERTWLSSDGTLRLQAKVYIEQTPGSDVDDSARTWFITSASNSATNVWEADNQGGADGPANPWGMSTMMYDENGMLYTLTWTVSEASAGTPATWNGNKVILGSSNYYALESTTTTGLSYSSIVPEVGKIYSADARMIIEDYFHFEYGLAVKTLVNKATNNAGGKANTYGDGNFNTDGWYVLTSDQTFTATGTDYMSDNNYFGRYNNMTLSFKFRYPTGSVGDGGVVARLDKSSGWMQLNMNSAGKFSIERYGNIIYDATPVDNTPLADLNPDTDYKFTFVFGAETFNVYLNGTKIYTAKSKNTTDKPDYLYLHTNGGYPASTATYWFKDVYLFARCLTESEIAML